jgi:signal transduction histidine kinase
MSAIEYSAAQALDALNRAALTIAGELDFEKVLQQIVDTARELVGARYAALGVPGQHGRLQQFIHSGMAREQVDRIPHLPSGKGLLGAIVTERKSLRVKQISHDPRSTGFPEGHPSMTSFLGVPIIGVGEPLGNLYLTDKIGSEEFSESDQKLVEMLAAHAAIAIQNAQLYEQVERLAILEERTRIGMDLHDGVIQSIYAVGLTLESTRLVLPDNAGESAQLLDSAVEGLNDAIRDIRNFILDLRPRRFSGDLSQGLARLVREFQANTMVPVSMTVSQQLENLPTSLARAIFLTTQESMANVARHARASNVTLTLMRSDSSVTLAINDNGLGFDPLDYSRQVGHGLANMQARSEGLGGTFRIRSAPGKGTTITMRLPI